MPNQPRSKRPTGDHPFAYMGVVPQAVANLFLNQSPPTDDDVRGFHIGSMWLVSNPDLVDTIQLWMLVETTGTTGTWVQLYPTSGQAGATDFITDSGTATQAGGNLNVLGGSNINTKGGTAATGTINEVNHILDDNVSVSGTVDVVPLNNGVVQNDAVTGLYVNQASDGQLLIGATGGEAQWNTLTSSDLTITITNGPNTINLEAVDGPSNFNTDSGTAISDAGAVNYFGDGTNTETTAATNVISVDLASDVSVDSWTTGTTVNVGNDLSVDGSIDFESIDSGILQNDVGPLFADFGSDGQLLISSSSGRPAWADVTSTGGTISITGGDNSLNIETTGGGGGGGRFAFLYTQNRTTSPVIGSGVQNYFLGADVILSEQFDNGNNMFPGNGAGSPAVYTVPVTGRWYFNAFVTINIPHPPGFTFCDTKIVLVTSVREYTVADRLYNNGSVSAIIPLTIDCFENLSASDTVSVYVMANTGVGGTNGVVDGGGIFTYKTWMSGYLVYPM